MTRKQILEQIEQVVAGQIEKKIGDAFLSPKIPTNTVSKPEAAIVQYPKADEIAQAEATLKAEIAAMAAGRDRFDRYGNEYLEIVHHDGTIEYIKKAMPLTPKESTEIHGNLITEDNFNDLLRREREAEERRQREAEEQRLQEQYQADDRWGQF